MLNKLKESIKDAFFKYKEGDLMYYDAPCDVSIFKKLVIIKERKFGRLDKDDFTPCRVYRTKAIELHRDKTNKLIPINLFIKNNYYAKEEYLKPINVKDFNMVEFGEFLSKS